MSWKTSAFQDIVVSSDLSGLKRFLTDKLYFEQLVRKKGIFYGQIRLRGLPE